MSERRSDEELTPEQISNWRRVLEVDMTDDEIRAMRKDMQRSFDAMVSLISEPEEIG